MAPEVTDAWLCPSGLQVRQKRLREAEHDITTTNPTLTRRQLLHSLVTNSKNIREGEREIKERGNPGVEARQSIPKKGAGGISFSFSCDSNLGVGVVSAGATPTSYFCECAGTIGIPDRGTSLDHLGDPLLGIIKNHV